jgi:ABC-type transport system involved in multi-copper enzyme maturation permease subunit
MFWSIFHFEIRYHLTNPLVYVTSGLLLLLAFGTVSSDSVQVGGAIGQVHRNAPIVILRLLGTMSIIGLFFVTAFVASAIHRDFEHRTHEIFFSRPMGTARLLLARFLGSVAVCLSIFLGPILGSALGSLMPWIEPTRLGPLSIAPYLWAMVVIVLPNVVLMGSVFFAIAGLTRSMLATYLGVLVALVAYIASQIFLVNLSNKVWAALLDPFGLAAVRVETGYWTIVERNSMLPDLSGVLLANRSLWFVIAVGALAVCLWRFDPARGPRRRRRTTELAGDRPGAVALTPPSPVAPIRSSRGFGPLASWRMVAHLARFETMTIIRSLPFVFMLLLGMINVLLAAHFQEWLYGTRVLPVTHLMLGALDSAYLSMLIIVIVLYAGETIWRDRSLGTAELHDALPAPTWVCLAGKGVALMVVILVFGAVGVASTVTYQLMNGYTRLEPGLYTSGLLLSLIPFALCCVLALMVQVLAKSKLLGYLVMIIYLLSDEIYRALDLDHNLYRFPSLPELSYSDMNGWGHLLAPYLWFALCWSLLSVVLLVVTALFWVRGTETSWRLRLRLARQRFTTPARAALIIGSVGFLYVGAFIYYNTNILNDYIPDDEREHRQAQYERLYRRHKGLAQPKITAVAADVDIFPEERRVEIRGRYTLRNSTSRAIRDLHLSLAPDVVVNRLALPPHRTTMQDDLLGYRIVELAEPLLPQATIEMVFDLTVANPGFVNNDASTSVVENGTFFSNRRYFPRIGYNESVELKGRNTRRKYGMPPDLRMAKVDDSDAREYNVLGADADRITLSTTVSTTEDQIAVAPGYLEDEWVEGGRRYFRYVTDKPIPNFFSFSSAAYSVRRDRWRDVAIEVYHHRSHDTNIERMIDSVKKTLDYCSSHYGPYQYRQVRVLEFPRYHRFAQSFPNTIPYSESLGFIARIDDTADIDTVFYITAHEMAHQWWGDQVLAANVQGADMIGESLAQYTALMVMEQEYGSDTIRRLLRYDLDTYLTGRGGELVEETPLMLVEQQPYIYYWKGSVVMYALGDYLGEDVMSRALARFVELNRFTGPPYATTHDLRVLLEAEAPQDRSQLLHDMLDTITLFSNRAVTATSTRLEDGRYRVQLEIEACKLRSDGHGVESAMPLDDWIDIGVLDADERVLYLEKHHLTTAPALIEVVVDSEPRRAGIDPFNKLIDRDPDDNLAWVHEG